MKEITIVNHTGFGTFMSKLMHKTRAYMCQSASKQATYTAILNHENPANAAADFAARTDTLSNGYPFLNGKIKTVIVTEVGTGSEVKIDIEMEETFKYHPKNNRLSMRGGSTPRIDKNIKIADAIMSKMLSHFK